MALSIKSGPLINAISAAHGGTLPQGATVRIGQTGTEAQPAGIDEEPHPAGADKGMPKKLSWSGS
jgi:hypothetical protein